MDYEKKYKEALERAKEIIDCSKSDTKEVRMVLSFFPELAESEDERIRKDIISYLKSSTAVSPKTWIDWLENQGKSLYQIHYWTEEEIEPIISDYLRGTEHYGGMIARLRCLKPKSLEKQGEQKSTDKVELMPTWSKEDERNYDIIYGIIYNSCNAEDASRLIAWLKAIKDRVVPQPQQQWKPTEEQMDALLYIFRHYAPTTTDKLAWDALQTLEFMLAQLKKLREE